MISANCFPKLNIAKFYFILNFITSVQSTPSYFFPVSSLKDDFDLLVLGQQVKSIKKNTYFKNEILRIIALQPVPEKHLFEHL